MMNYDTEKFNLQQVLLSWGLEKSVVEVLKDNKIENLSLLAELVRAPEDFRSLVPTLIHRLKITCGLNSLTSKHRTSVNAIHSNKLIQPPTDSDSSVYSEPLHFFKLENYEEESISSWTTNDVSITNSNAVTTNDTPTNKLIVLDNYILEPVNNSNSVTPSDSNSTSVNLFNLSDLLDQSIVGRAIKCIYSLEHELDSRCQSYLVDIIVEHFVNKTPFRRLVNNDFKNISVEITKCFPRETELVYYTPPISKRNSRDNKTGIARGKLVDKYRNKLTFLRKARILPKRGAEDNSANDTIEESAPTNNEQGVLWLKNNHEPWSEVRLHWNETYTFRQDFLKKDIDISVFLTTFPIIANPFGHDLVEADFNRKFPEQAQLVFKNFENVFHILIDLKKKNLNQSDQLVLHMIQLDELNDDSRHYLMISLLTSLLPMKTHNKRTKSNWHPTTSEVTESIVTQVKTSADIENAIELRESKLKKYGVPSLPFVIVEGPSFREIRNVYVSYNKILYKLQTFLKGLNVCFQLMHVLNLVYPFESDHVWLFIQLTMYKLKTRYDNIPSIIDIANKINNKPDATV